MRVGHAAAAMLLGVLSSSAARAQSSEATAAGDAGSPGARQAAIELAKQAARAYEQGKCDEASKLLVVAHGLSPEPVLLYDLGRAYEQCSRCADAITTYEQYLHDVPDATDRPVVEQSIARCRHEIAPAPRVVTDVPADRGLSPLPWVIGGTGVAALGAGIVLGVLADQRHDAATQDPVALGAQAKQSDAQSFATSADVCFVAGSVLTVAGVLWEILQLSGRPAARSAFVFEPSLGGASVRGTF
jgi:hypothetical protein